jgi:hypothetical protein
MKEVRTDQNRKPRVEAESSTSTVALRVVGGDEKGSVESQTIKYGEESHWISSIYLILPAALWPGVD